MHKKKTRVEEFFLQTNLEINFINKIITPNLKCKEYHLRFSLSFTFQRERLKAKLGYHGR